MTNIELTNIAKILSENVVTTFSELSIPIDKDSLDQILKHMPVMFLKGENGGLLLNLTEFVYTPGAVEALLKCCDKSHEVNKDDDVWEDEQNMPKLGKCGKFGKRTNG